MLTSWHMSHIAAAGRESLLSDVVFSDNAQISLNLASGARGEQDEPWSSSSASSPKPRYMFSFDVPAQVRVMSDMMRIYDTSYRHDENIWYIT